MMRPRTPTDDRVTNQVVPRAFTLLELTVAAAMLAMLATSAVQMMRLVNTHQRSAERRMVAYEALQAVADEIGNIPWDKLTADAAKRIGIPKPLQSYLPGATLSVALNDEAGPAVAKRVQLAIALRGVDGQPAAPVRLTTWIFPERAVTK